MAGGHRTRDRAGRSCSAGAAVRGDRGALQPSLPSLQLPNLPGSNQSGLCYTGPCLGMGPAAQQTLEQDEADGRETFLDHLPYQLGCLV